MDYIGTIFIAIVCLVLGYVMGRIKWKRNILKSVSDCKTTGEYFMEQFKEEGDTVRETQMQGYIRCANDILEEYGIKEEQKDEG